MPKRKNDNLVINIDDSSDEEISVTDCYTFQLQDNLAAANIDSPQSTSKPHESSQSKKTSTETYVPRTVVNRRKSVHHTIKSTENISFEIEDLEESENGDDLLEEAEKNQGDIETSETVDKNLDDPDVEEMLKKIAYCRVFTNYLLRQYDMLSLDFKLFSNLDLLNLDLKKRVDTYSAIHRNRRRFKEIHLMKDSQINK